MQQKLLSAFASLAFALLFSQNLAAQCQYRLELYDSFGDGWGGGQLGIFSGSNAYVFSLDNQHDDGVDTTVYIEVVTGQPLKFVWAPGNYNAEVSFDVYRYDGSLLFSKADPATGVIYDGVGACPSCLQPANFRLENVWADHAKLRWDPYPGAVSWNVVYGPTGFDPATNGDTVHTALPKINLTGLSELTKYDVYLYQSCGGGDFSELQGPISFETYRKYDVGIASITTPTSSCNLGNETVTVCIRNFGAEPQSLVPFFYSVNGSPAGIPFPDDGLYTGVLGKDSCEFIQFDTKYNFSQPGEYLIQAWTAQDSSHDTNRANDTLTFRIVNRLQVPYNQDFETWGGGYGVIKADSQNSSWAYGKPAGQVIAAAHSGQTAWVTNLTGAYNKDEKSYLTSPCMDFSSLTENPFLEFYTNQDIEADYDGAWLEISTNAGQTWQKLGTTGEGLRWYNNLNANSLGEVWAGNSGGWVKTRHELTGTKGQGEVQIRFAFQSDNDIQLEGMGIDDIQIKLAETRDLFADQISADTDGSDCGDSLDHVHFHIVNFGKNSSSIYKVAYSLNGGPPVVETPGMLLASEQQLDYQFTKSFDSRDQLSQIRCWILYPQDLNMANDTADYTLDHRPLPVPFSENFESRQIPASWTVPATAEVTNGHANTSFVLSFDLYDLEPAFEYDLPRYGPISTGDTLEFDYRITDFDGDGTIATDLTNGSHLEVQASTNCGANWVTLSEIDGSTHTPSVDLQHVALGLDQFAGHGIGLRVVGTWAAGDFFFDLDNINLRACPTAGLAIGTTSVNPIIGLSNGSITVASVGGTAPFQYKWSNSSTAQTITGLAGGTYTVTVTDGKGCTGSKQITLVATVGTDEIAGLRRFAVQPNPTSGRAMLKIELDYPADGELQVLNLLGETVWGKSFARATSVSEPLDLSGWASGLYFVRLRVSEQAQTLKLVKAE